jgi:hypothetical protein
VAHRDRAAGRVFHEVDVLGEGVHHRSLHRRHTALGQGGPVEQGDDALADGAHVVEAVWPEYDASLAATPNLVVTSRVALVDELPAADQDNGMDALVIAAREGGV